MKQFYFFLILSIFSCSEKELSDQKNLLIEPSQFSKILKEIYLSESNFELTKINNKEIAENTIRLEYKEIYSQYETNEDAFLFSLEYYTARLDELEVIYSEVLQTLKEEQLDL